MLLIVFLGSASASDEPIKTAGDKAYGYLRDLVEPQRGIGARVSATVMERKAANYIHNRFQCFGYQVQRQEFSFSTQGEELHSANVIAEVKGNSPLTIIVGAHYDSTGTEHGSLGAMDNGTGVAVLLALAEAIAESESLPYSVRFIAFGAEEERGEEEVYGYGSRAYLQQLKAENPKALEQIIGMINLDTIAGGDYLYVHSAHEKPYPCVDGSQDYTADARLREALFSAANQAKGEGEGEGEGFRLHPENDSFPAGQTGEWSDHASFACAGIPIAYIETTNFTLNGEHGFDGYSQTGNENLWDCYNSKQGTACDREKENQWGKIWHTGFDRLDRLNSLMPGRVKAQLSQSVAALRELLVNAEFYYAPGQGGIVAKHSEE